MRLDQFSAKQVIHSTMVQRALSLASFGLAEDEDLEALLDLHAAFFAESAGPVLGLTFARDKTRAWLQNRHHCPHLVAKIDHRPVGFVSFTLEDLYTEEKVAFLNTFYVEKAHRRSALGRVLLLLAIKLARDEGARGFVATAVSGMPTVSSLHNLFLKAGFHSSGFAVMRGL